MSGLLDGYTPVSLGTISSSIVVNTREGILQVISKELTADYEQKFDGVAGIKTLNDGTFCMLGDTSGARTFVKGETKNVAGVDDQKITGIDWQDQLFRLAGNTGLSSTADLYSGVPHTESEYLDIAKIEKRHGENKYLSNGAIRSVLTVSKDVLSASDPVTIPGGQLSSY